MLEILERIVEGKPQENDIEKLKTLAGSIKTASLCGLGQSAPNPVLSTINYFEDEYIAHIRDHKCPAHHCKAYLQYVIDTEKCRSCGLCAKVCPVNAISGSRTAKYAIDQTKCIKCGACMARCPFGAISQN